jgi:hypothetical protein
VPVTYSPLDGDGDDDVDDDDDSVVAVDDSNWVRIRMVDDDGSCCRPPPPAPHKRTRPHFGDKDVVRNSRSDDIMAMTVLDPLVQKKCWYYAGSEANNNRTNGGWFQGTMDPFLLDLPWVV